MAEPIRRIHTIPVRYQPKAPDASVDRLLEVAGIVQLDGPIPDTDALGEVDEGA